MNRLLDICLTFCSLMCFPDPIDLISICFQLSWVPRCSSEVIRPYLIVAPKLWHRLPLHFWRTSTLKTHLYSVALSTALELTFFLLSAVTVFYCLLFLFLCVALWRTGAVWNGLYNKFNLILTSIWYIHKNTAWPLKPKVIALNNSSTVAFSCRICLIVLNLWGANI